MNQPQLFFHVVIKILIQVWQHSHHSDPKLDLVILLQLMIIFTFFRKLYLYPPVFMITRSENL